MQAKKIILGFVGEIASGKGTAAKYLADKHGAHVRRFSTSMRDVLNRLYLDISRHNMQRISFILREEFGQDIFANIIANDVKNDPTAIIAVDGIRREADLKYLQELPEFKLVYITADMKTRFERLIKRGENEDDAGKTFEQFLKDHEAETEVQIPIIGQRADIRLENAGNPEDLYKQLDKIIASMND